MEYKQLSDTSIFEELSKERKLLQETSKLPEWFTTQGWQMFKERYLYEADTYEDQIDRIVNTLAKHCKTNQKYLSKRWKETLMKGHAYLATPVLANTGTKRGFPVSCSGGYVGNSIYDFYNTQTETAMLTKKGFGTSAYLGDIIPRGTKISEGGSASGVLPVYKDYVQLSQDVSQGAMRRGAWAGYIEADHPDFWEISEFVKNNPDSANIGWNITDNFINKLENGNSQTDLIFQRMLLLKALTGKGYFFFPDKVNRLNPKMYEKNNLKVKASNLCVVPETQILTKKGYFSIADLENQEIEIWNGEKFTKTVVRKTSERSKIIKIKTSSGQELECTEYHKFYIKNSYDKPMSMVRANNLKIGDKLIKFDLPIIEGDMNLTKAYQNGFYSGDGCLVQGKNRIYLYNEKKNLEYLFDLNNRTNQPEQNRIYGYEDGLKDKFFVPSCKYTVQSRLNWLAGLCDADGTIARNGNNESLQIASIEKEFLKEIQLMLQTLGITSKLNFTREEGSFLLPKNDGSGELKYYNCQEIHRLLISSNGLFKLSQLGFKTHRLKWDIRKPQRDSEHFIKILEVVDEGRYDVTYCFNEPERQMGMFNGILTGNCSEITLHSDENHTFTCVLSGMIATKYDDWKDTDAVYCMTIFLDCLVEEFLELARNVKGLEKTVRATEKGRAIGLGITGLHSLFQSRMLPFGSFEAHMLNNEIFEHIQDKTLEASQWMAKEWGEPQWCQGFGVRNTHRTALAPNVSSALIFGSHSQGISPWYGNVYNEGSQSGAMFRVNPEFIKLLKEKNRYNDDIINSVLDNNGSCQHLEFLNEEEKEVFLTAFEINQRDIIRLASTRQKYICQSQSLNLFFDANEDEAYIAEIHKEAFLDPNIKSLYYMRSKAGVQASRGVCTACES